jgi:bacillolysin
MPRGFESIRYNAAERSDQELSQVGTRGITHRGTGRGREGSPAGPRFHTDEAAARFFLGQVLASDARERVRGLTAPDRPEAVPDLRFKSIQQVPDTRNRLVHFDQTQSSIPVFGSRVVVQLDQNRELVDVGGDVAEIKQVSPVASWSPADALGQIAALTGVGVGDLAAVSPPELTYFRHPNKETWHLSFFFKKVPAAPPEYLSRAADCKSHGHGRGLSPRQKHALLNYLVDAHDGHVLYYYPASPLLTGVPVELDGESEVPALEKFWGRMKTGGGFELFDPLRGIRTYDLGGGDIDSIPLPADPVHNAAANLGTAHRGAVSAHVNATKVFDYFNGILARHSVDDKGMELVSVVNCTYPADQAPPEWHNAVWYDNKMWYGQDSDGNGQLRSFSRFLDVIAHELTHGVTEHTSNLVYQDQSGALNESFSDIFGIIIANWDPTNPNKDVGTWTWTLGAGLGSNGGPLRDLSNPAATGDPDHMNNFLVTFSDNGGVHTNSNIHNKAAYNVLTAVDSNNARVFTPKEVGVLYYLCLSRLSSLAQFSDVRQGVLDVAAIYFPNPAKQAACLAAIRAAYDAVGIQ